MTNSPPTLHQYQINATTVAGDDSTTSSTTQWSSETNWIVSRGSLDAAVTFESFDFPIDSEFTPRKPPLLLLPPSSSDFEPCEIKLNFTQKHEIRQVYVRSTARVYEIYYAPALNSDNEYLCTVRCSAASVEDNLLPAIDVNEATYVNLVGPNGTLPKGRVAGENEDDWVEVKLPVGQVDQGNTYLSNQTSNNHQDYYEATAEINDSDSCISLTIRLLSLQTKDCVYVDEVYVFADPIDTNDSENQESSTESSLMTMLVPTLLGLSKSKSLQIPDHDSSKSTAKPVESAASTNLVKIADQQNEKMLKDSAPDEDKVCDLMVKNEVTYNRTEILLEQLVSRVTRIEDICVRFEENMLNPINKMEERLQNVEQQVKLLAKNSQFPVSPSSPRFNRSVSNDGIGFKLCGESESEKEIDKVPKDASESFSCDEKEELEKEKPKKHVSIDDALAAALAGFSSFTKVDDNISLETSKEDITLASNSSGESLNDDSAKSSKPLNEEASESLNDETTKFSELLNEETTKSSESPNEETSESLNDEASESLIDDTAKSSELLNEETTKSIESPNEETTKYSESLNDEATNGQLVNILTFDKFDILKHFPDQSSDVIDESESKVDFKSSILEVKFASTENCSLESLLSCSDDPVTDDGGLIITSQSNVCDSVTANENNLLVDLDGEGGQQELLLVQQEAAFGSLI